MKKSWRRQKRKLDRKLKRLYANKTGNKPVIYDQSLKTVDVASSEPEKQIRGATKTKMYLKIFIFILYIPILIYYYLKRNEIFFNINSYWDRIFLSLLPPLFFFLYIKEDLRTKESILDWIGVVLLLVLPATILLYLNGNILFDMNSYWYTVLLLFITPLIFIFLIRSIYNILNTEGISHF